MKQTDDLLREACAELAEEETDALEQSLNRTAIREAEEVYRHHRPKALRLIRRYTRKAGTNAARMLPIAAALVIALGGVLLALRKPASDSIEQTQLPSEISVQPFYTDSGLLSPTSMISSTTFVPSTTPTEVSFPTLLPIATDFSTVVPTLIPLPSRIPTQVPTPVPTFAPTATPQPAVSPTSASIAPTGWQGEHFPSLLPPGFELLSVSREDDGCTAAYTRYGQTLIFTEYDASHLIETPARADYSYIEINGETALQVKSEDGVTLTWSQDGHTLSLFTPQGDGIDIAQSVKKITDE